MSMLVRVIRGQLESSVYEDQCRSLLGTGSYELFTLDKLSAKIVKHMQLMLQDETTTKLWELYKYERSRTLPIHTTLYHVNCHAVLTDDPCFRIAYNTGNSTLTITLVEPDKAPEALGNAAEGYVTDYIKSYVSTPTPCPPTECQLYLKRNLSQRARQGPDAELVEVLRSVAIFNGLECKISCTTSKVSYVLDTEDVMCRKLQQRRSETDSQKQLRSDRFTRWLDERTAIRSEVLDTISWLGVIPPRFKAGVHIHLVTYYDDLGSAYPWAIRLPVQIITIDFLGSPGASVPSQTMNLIRPTAGRGRCAFHPYEVRELQVQMGAFPTTIIGCFPQTAEVRWICQQLRRAKLFGVEYEQLITGRIAGNVWLGGMCFTTSGWVQSYGSRYVRPPVIMSDTEFQGSITMWECPDVLTIENSRSDNAMTAALAATGYSRDIRPVVYDVHSPEVPSEGFIGSRIRYALRRSKFNWQAQARMDVGIPWDGVSTLSLLLVSGRGWAETGPRLKMRGWAETVAALRNMVTAAVQVRSDLAVQQQNDIAGKKLAPAPVSAAETCPQPAAARPAGCYDCCHPRYEVRRLVS
ncbi:hypothetical protein VOLCADRAFT_120353 [Volvox carteri f. nagariensis]|uniref:Uncharacterized protein n=1 Tax=Volvox carteri f. nagariensis TaxID=3068 RepID=D8TKS7_VOLCA|nr:uncharacterized protein VOLCADRAFT_120353 [Volvox carteri f. nagariensis]EFJ52116.1 hypothetical protein VOLCADRAFT_120353 [Volvox carteri f. nagariensis]|eukprot:XP_002946890.1 hypothetical protein VOLCADRAFT_120353 [Volvox carteri f. nagariensis]